MVDDRSPRRAISGQVKAALILLTCAAAVYQSARVAEWTASMMTRKVLVNWPLDALSRGADAAYGETYMRFVQEARAAVPEEATVVLLGRTGRPQFESAGFLQYFLFPRRVETCGSAPVRDCVARPSAGPRYFLVSGPFDDTGEVPAGFGSQSLGEDLTLLSPREGQPE